MIKISMAYVRRRWAGFAASFLALALGIALMTMTISGLVATRKIAGHLEADGSNPLQPAHDMTVQSTTLIICVVVFVVFATFAFMIDQRRREMALLSLLGATPGQVLRMVLGEALIVAVAAAILGVLLGPLGTGELQNWMIRHAIAPSWFRIDFSLPALVVAALLGVAAALLGALIVSFQAASVRPIALLRDAAAQRRQLSVPRLLIGLFIVMVAAAAAARVLAKYPEHAANPRKFGPVPLLFVLGMVLLSPLGLRLLTSVTAWIEQRAGRQSLVQSSTRFAQRRTAAVIVPVVLALGLAASILTVGSMADQAKYQRAQHEVSADFVLKPGHSPLPSSVGIAGATVTPLWQVPIELSDPAKSFSEGLNGQAVAPAAMGRALTPVIRSGSLRNLGKDFLVIDQQTATANGLSVGTSVQVAVEGNVASTARVAAIIPTGLSGDDTYLSSALLPAATLRRTPSVTFVSLAEGTDMTAAETSVRAATAPSGAAVQTRAQWLSQLTNSLSSQTRTASYVILGIVLLYALVALANTVVMATFGRRREYATLSLVGATRPQVQRFSAAEAAFIVVLGVVPAAVAAVASVTVQKAALSQLVQGLRLSVPWTMIGSTLVICMGIAVTSGVAATLSVTRGNPLESLGARE